MRCEKCATCRYSWKTPLGSAEAPEFACDYLLRKKRRRPCPPGEECTVWELSTDERPFTDNWFGRKEE